MSMRHEYVSCVMCHVSCVMCHVSCVMCHVDVDVYMDVRIRIQLSVVV
jgi:hypothetical protein